MLHAVFDTIYSVDSAVLQTFSYIIFVTFQLDSKYGIRVDAAVDEPKIMIVHVGAHAASLSNIR